MLKFAIILGLGAWAFFHLKGIIMSNADQANAKLDTISANLAEASSEIVAGLQDLRDQLANLPQTVPDSVMSRLDDIEAKSKLLADIFPSAPAV